MKIIKNQLLAWEALLNILLRSLLVVLLCIYGMSPVKVNAQINASASEPKPILESTVQKETAAAIKPSPVWQKISEKYTKKEIFQKALALGDKHVITVKEVEDALGMKFQAAKLNSEGVNRYIAESDVNFERASIFLTIGKSNKYWVLGLSGFNAPSAEDQCVSWTDAINYIHQAGWQDQRALDFSFFHIRYVKESEQNQSRVFIGIRTSLTKPDDCITEIQINQHLMRRVDASAIQGD